MRLAKFLFPILGIFVLLFFVFVGGRQRFDTRTRAYEESLVEELDLALGELSRQITLPAGEDPILSIITDKTFLPENPTKIMIAPGDYLIVYQKQKRGFIYRPGTKKFVTYYENIDYKDPSAK